MENENLTPAKDELKASYKLYNLKNCKVKFHISCTFIIILLILGFLL